MSYDPVPGMRVVCVSESYQATSMPDERDAIPRKGQVYTVRGLHRLGNLWLVEIRNKRRGWSTGRHEYAFHPSRFKPLDERRLDIFRAILTKAPRPKEMADA